MVFGGGHVVLPLLEAETVAKGVMSRDEFLAGYGFAQAVPGPMFSFGAYVGGLVGLGRKPMAGRLAWNHIDILTRHDFAQHRHCLLYTSPSPRDRG